MDDLAEAVMRLVEAEVAARKVVPFAEWDLLADYMRRAMYLLPRPEKKEAKADEDETWEHA